LSAAARRRAAKILVRSLGAARIGLGSAIVVATDPALAALGFERREPLTRALARLAGSRDLALGAIAMTATGEDGLRRAALAGAACDASDAVAFGLAAIERGELDRATLGGVGSALVATAAGVWALAALSRD
jgi:hypothetical protein